MRKYFPKRPSGAPFNTLSKLCDVPVGFVTLHLEAVYCLICGCQRVAMSRIRMICLVYKIVLCYLVSIHEYGFVLKGSHYFVKSLSYVTHIKASAHSFQCFSSRLLKVTFSLSMHMLPRMNVSLAARNTEQVNITKNLIHGRIRTTNTASLAFHRVPLTTRLSG